MEIPTVKIIIIVSVLRIISTLQYINYIIAYYIILIKHSCSFRGIAYNAFTSVFRSKSFNSSFVSLIFDKTQTTTCR